MCECRIARARGLIHNLAMQAPSRRGFLIGLSAALAATNLPVMATTSRAIPVFTIPEPIPYSATFQALAWAVQSVVSQVMAFAPRPDEYAAVQESMEAALRPIMPVAVRLVLSGPLDWAISGDFSIREDGHDVLIGPLKALDPASRDVLEQYGNLPLSPTRKVIADGRGPDWVAGIPLETDAAFRDRLLKTL